MYTDYLLTNSGAKLSCAWNPVTHGIPNLHISSSILSTKTNYVPPEAQGKNSHNRINYYGCSRDILQKQQQLHHTNTPQQKSQF